jgi:hypothetical protein
VERLIGRPPCDHDARFDEDVVLRSYLLARRSDLRSWLSRLDGSGFLMLNCSSRRTPNLLPDAWKWLVSLRGSTESGRVQQGRGMSLPDARALTVHAWRPTFENAADFVRFTNESVDRGIEFFDFEGLDTFADESITWLRQAVRYARREAQA